MTSCASSGGASLREMRKLRAELQVYHETQPLVMVKSCLV